MVLSAEAADSLRNVLLVFIAHTLTNAALLSPINPLRCSYWNKQECSSDEAWICNWLAFAHLHVAVLLGCFMVKAETWFMEQLGYLCCTIIMCYVMEGIFAIDSLDQLLAGIQCVVYVVILVAISYLTYEDPSCAQNPLRQPLMKKMKSSSSFDQRKKLPIPTIAVLMHSISSILRVVDMTFGNGREGYKGDMSSPVYQSISSFAVCDMMLAGFILLFSLRFCSMQQHKVVLAGQAFTLFISQIMLTSSQGEKMDDDMALAGSIGTFVFIVIAVVGAL